MRTINDRRLLPASVVAAIFAAFQLAFVQVAGASSVPTTQSLQSVGTPASLVSQAQISAAQIQITPEQLGDTLSAHKQYQAAIEAYKKAPRDSAAVWNKMGISYQLLFDSNEAMRCYLTSLRLDPRNGSVMNNLATIYVTLKDYHSADRYYRKALKLDPKSAVILKNRGSELLARHKFKQGGEFYAAALAVDPDIFNSSTSPRVADPTSSADRGAMNYYMAITCVRAGMTDQAIDYLRMALNDKFTSPKKIVADSEFAGLHNVPAFEQLLAAQSNP
ncbi:MAG: tetratricopeptide repeat protein [Terracidiphilus sp.]|jgi:Tfp pilus assembly protein PilF